MTDTISINREELNTLIRSIVKDELNKITEISEEEQSELEELYKDSLDLKDYDKNNCVRL